MNRIYLEHSDFYSTLIKMTSAPEKEWTDRDLLCARRAKMSFAPIHSHA